MDNYLPLTEASKLSGKHLKTIRRFIKTISEKSDTRGVLAKRIETPQGYSWLVRRDIISSFSEKHTKNKTHSTPLWGGQNSGNVQVDISKNVQVDILKLDKAYNNDDNVQNGHNNSVYSTPLWGGQNSGNVQVDISKNVQVDILKNAMADNMKTALSLLEQQLTEKDKQLQEKDKQISSLLERQRESHILINTQMKQIENGFKSLSAQTEASGGSSYQEGKNVLQNVQQIRNKRTIKQTVKPKQFSSSREQQSHGFLSWFLGE